MEKQTIWYEKHPVSPERKQQLRDKGYRILDIQFMPEGYVQEGEDGLDNNGDGNITVNELRADLEKRGIAFKKSASKAELQQLLLAAIADEKAKEETAKEDKTPEGEPPVDNVDQVTSTGVTDGAAQDTTGQPASTI